MQHTHNHSKEQNNHAAAEKEKPKEAGKKPVSRRKKPASQNKVLAEAIMQNQNIKPDEWLEEQYASYIKENSKTLVAALQR